MPRKVGEHLRCDKCGAELIYMKACPCPGDMPHREVCCGVDMRSLGVDTKFVPVEGHEHQPDTR